MSEQSLSLQPALYGGITLQPESVRQPHQVSDANNVTFSVVDGMSKRPPMWWVADVSSAPAATDLRLHSIYRDENEKYLVVYGYNFLSVIEVGGRRSGQACTVNLGSGVSTYLTTNNPTASDLKLVTVGDTTLIVNTKVATGSLASPNYTVTNTYRDYNVMLCDSPATGTYHRALADTTEQASGFWLHDLSSGGGGTFATYRGWINGPSANDPRWAIANGYWSEAAQNGVFYIGFQRVDMNISGGTWTAATRRLTKAGSFASYTLSTGDSIYITGGTGHTAGWYPIKSRIDNDTIELEEVTGLSASDNTNTTTDSIGIAITFSLVTPGAGAADMNDVALNIQASGRSQGGVARDLLVKWVPYYSGGYFIFTSPYRGSTTTVFPPVHVSGYNYTVSTAPFSATASQYVITAGTGSPTSQTLTVEDRWTRQTAPNQPESRPDPAKMPVQMVRTTAGSGPTTAVFDVSQITWDSRPSGNEDSNPLPDFIIDQQPISDAAFHLDRLVLASGESVAFSQSGNLFNFFQEDEGTLVDSDAFQRQVSSDAVTKIDHLVSLNKTLYVFTRAGRQFSISSPEALTPGTAAITPATAYQTIPVRPRPINDRLYFVGFEKDKASLREYEYVQDRESNEARDVSAHVPGLIPSSVRDLATSPNDHTAVLSATDSDVLYVYRAHWSGQEKVQSAWTKFDLSAGGIFGIATIKSDVYVLLRRSEIGVTIERFGVGDVTTDSSDDLYPPNIAFPAAVSAQAAVTVINGDSTATPVPVVAYADVSIAGVIADNNGSGPACSSLCPPATYSSTDCSYCASTYVDAKGTVYARCGCLTTRTCADSSPQAGTCCYANASERVTRFQQLLCRAPASTDTVEPDIDEPSEEEEGGIS